MTSDDRLASLEASGLVDGGTFAQILEMDDDEDGGDFSRSIVFDFFEQAEQTFDKMDRALDQKDLKELGELGHFLKGSSATLGLIKVKDNCEKIQHYGAMKDASGTKDVPDVEKCLHLLKQTIRAVKSDYEEVEIELRKFYA